MRQHPITGYAERRESAQEWSKGSALVLRAVFPRGVISRAKRRTSSELHLEPPQKSPVSCWRKDWSPPIHPKDCSAWDFRGRPPAIISQTYIQPARIDSLGNGCSARTPEWIPVSDFKNALQDVAVRELFQTSFLSGEAPAEKG